LVDIPARTKVFTRGELWKYVDGTTTNDRFYATLRNVTARWGHRIVQEIVGDSDIPITTTAEFSGEIEGEFIAGADDEIISKAPEVPNSTTGEVEEYDFRFKEKTAEPTPTTKTWTIKGKFTQVERAWRTTDGFIYCRFRAIMTAQPTVA